MLNKTKKVTEYLIYVVFWAMVLYDIIAISFGHDASITSLMRRSAHAYPIIPFCLGCFAALILERSKNVKL